MGAVQSREGPQGLEEEFRLSHSHRKAWVWVLGGLVSLISCPDSIFLEALRTHRVICAAFQVSVGLILPYPKRFQMNSRERCNMSISYGDSVRR